MTATKNRRHHPRSATIGASTNAFAAAVLTILLILASVVSDIPRDM